MIFIQSVMDHANVNFHHGANINCKCSSNTTVNNNELFSEAQSIECCLQYET